MTRQTRRRLISGIATASITLSAGCLGLLGNNDQTFDSPSRVVSKYISTQTTLWGGNPDEWVDEVSPLLHPQSTLLDNAEEDLGFFTRFDEERTIESYSTNTVERDLTETQVRSLTLTTPIDGSLADLLSNDTALVDGRYSFSANFDAPEQSANNARYLVATADEQWKIVGIVGGPSQ
jgi:hypothetical protein